MKIKYMFINLIKHLSSQSITKKKIHLIKSRSIWDAIKLK
jgi:hypothetical protein